jgi:DNA-binding transcriptional ArsR family regulator
VLLTDILRSNSSKIIEHYNRLRTSLKTFYQEGVTVIDDVVQPDREEIDLPTVLGALADAGRLATVRNLAKSGESCCRDLQSGLGLDCSKSTWSHHLRVLREAGLTRTRVDGARRYVSLRRDDIDARFPGLLDSVL